MTWISKYKYTKKKAIFVALFLVSAFFLLSTVVAYNSNVFLSLAQSAHAQVTCPTGQTPGPGGICISDNTQYGFGTTAETGTNIDTTCSPDNALDIPGQLACIFKMLLVGILGFFGWILAAAAALFTWVVNPANISGDGGILNKPSIVEIWTNVRDFLNMFFIMVLLFSAFCTIFQVDKWNLKKVWLNILLNALLVNFSFTIARFFIDVSNVTMYYLLNNMFPTVTVANAGGIFGNIAHNSGLEAIINPKGNISGMPWSFLIASIVFVFILAVTLLVLAVMFVIRLIALAIIIMFAPVGFVGYIFPALHKYADDWWTNLFNYAFFAPIMVFMLAVAIRIMNAMGAADMKAFLEAANGQSTGSSDANWIANAAFFTIPIIILWIGMGISQKMSIAGADAVVGSAKKWSKGIGKWAVNTPWKSTGIPGGVKQKYDNVKQKFDSTRQQREARIAASGPFADKGALEKDMKRRAEEYKKNNLSESELKDKARLGDAAAAYRLADDKNIDQRTYSAFMASRPNPALMGAFNSKVKQTRRDLAATYNADNMTAAKMQEIRDADPTRAGWTDAQVRQHNINEEMGKMSAEDWNTQSWNDIADTGDARVIAATRTAHANLQPEAQTEVRKRLNPNNAATLNTRMGIVL